MALSYIAYIVQMPFKWLNKCNYITNIHLSDFVLIKHFSNKIDMKILNIINTALIVYIHTYILCPEFLFAHL